MSFTRTPLRVNPSESTEVTFLRLGSKISKRIANSRRRPLHKDFFEITGLDDCSIKQLAAALKASKTTFPVIEDDNIYSKPLLNSCNMQYAECLYQFGQGGTGATGDEEHEPRANRLQLMKNEKSSALDSNSCRLLF